MSDRKITKLDRWLLNLYEKNPANLWILGAAIGTVLTIPLIMLMEWLARR